MTALDSRLGYRAVYDATQYTRAGAWFNLQRQQIPGCPQVLRQKLGARGYVHGWRKAHVPGSGFWAWIYIG